MVLRQGDQLHEPGDFEPVRERGRRVHRIDEVGELGVEDTVVAVEAQEALAVAGEGRREDLDRDLAVEGGVLGFPDDAHAAFADLFEEAVVEEEEGKKEEKDDNEWAEEEEEEEEEEEDEDEEDEEEKEEEEVSRSAPRMQSNARRMESNPRLMETPLPQTPPQLICIV